MGNWARPRDILLDVAATLVVERGYLVAEVAETMVRCRRSWPCN